MNGGPAFCILLMGLSPAWRFGQPGAPAAAQTDPVRETRALFEGGQWEEIVRRSAPEPGDPADLNYYRGMALAHLRRWSESHAELEAGRRKSPRDKRFPLELAGVAFRQGRSGEARTLIEAALRLDPADRYANDFAGTLFLLEGNTRAALKFWNRIGKPEVEEIRNIPDPAIDPVLLDRAFVLRPASIATLRDYDTTLARLDFLQTFQSRGLELVPRQDERFDLVFRNLGRAGLSTRVLPSLVTLLSGVPFATVYPELLNINHAALNAVSLVRWDPRKRRLALSLSGPVQSDPSRRITFDFDARDEEWDVSGAVKPGLSGTQMFSMKRIGAGLAFGMISGSWVFETGGAVTRRDFHLPREDSMGRSLQNGLSLKYTLGVGKDLYSSPEHGLELKSRADLQLGNFSAADDGRFVGFGAGVYPRWHPASRRADFAVLGRIQLGAISRAAPFDDFFSFGLERDNDLFLRGHGGTKDGRKGQGPLGTRYFLGSCELEKSVSNTGMWRVTAGPFIDIGRMYDVHGVFGSQGWLYDLGIQSKISVLNMVSITVSFGRDLRSGGQVLFVNTSSGRK